MRRYSLARVATASPYAERLERMEEIAARDRPDEPPRGRDNGQGPAL